MIRAFVVATAILLGAWAQTAQAVPIVYLGTLQSGVPVTDTVPDGGPNNPLLADYWQFTLSQAADITLTGHRLEGGLDPAFYLHRGTYTDTDEFGGNLGSNAPLGFADDELTAAIPGPFGDPFLGIHLPEGTYTVSFVSFANSGNGPFGYCLELNGPATNCADRQVPLPATLVLLGLGAGTSGMVGLLRYGRNGRRRR